MAGKQALVVALAMAYGGTAVAVERFPATADTAGETSAAPVMDEAALQQHIAAVTGSLALTPQAVDTLLAGFEKLADDPGSEMMAAYLQGMARRGLASLATSFLSSALGSLSPGATAALGLVQQLGSAVGVDASPEGLVERAIIGDGDGGQGIERFFPGLDMQVLQLYLQQIALGQTLLEQAGDPFGLDEAALDAILATTVAPQVSADPSLRARARALMVDSARMLLPYRERLAGALPSLTERDTEATAEKIEATLAAMRESRALSDAATESMQRRVMAGQRGSTLAARLAPGALTGLMGSANHAATVSSMMSSSSQLSADLTALPAKHGLGDEEFHTLRDLLTAGLLAIRLEEGEPIEREDILLHLPGNTFDAAAVEAAIAEAKRLARPHREELEALVDW